MYFDVKFIYKNKFLWEKKNNSNGPKKISIPNNFGEFKLLNNLSITSKHVKWLNNIHYVNILYIIIINM